MGGSRKATGLWALLLATVLAWGAPSLAHALTASGQAGPADDLTTALPVAGLSQQAAADGNLASLSGSGTQADPYKLSSAGDYAILQAAVNVEGVDCAGLFFKQTADVTLPSGWKPIGCRIDESEPGIQGGSNLRAFGGTLDGGGFTLTVPAGSKPLFGYVKGATIRNLAIYGTRIEGYGLIDNMEGYGLNGTAVVVDGITIKAGTKTLKSGILGCVPTTNALAGTSIEFVSTIRNCTVEAGVEIGYDGTQSEIGSIAGRLNGTVQNCTSAATVKGRDFVGGIVGARDNAMGTYTVGSCTFSGAVEAAGSYAGGIAGGNYDNSTAPNGKKPVIENCSATGTVVGADRVGGIMGGDEYGIQAWDDARIANNAFTGKVSARNGAAVGGIVGYYANLNKHDSFQNNCFKAGCGAQNAFGKVVSVDTSNKAYAGTATAPHGPDAKTGAYYYNSAGATNSYLRTADNAVKALLETPASSYQGVAHKNENRTDDPLGADAATLAYSNATGELENACVVLDVSGSYKTAYVVGDALSTAGMVITGTWSDGTSRQVAVSDCTFSGYDFGKAGNQTITIAYGYGVARVQVTVAKGPNPLVASALAKSKIPAATYGKAKTIAAAKAFAVSKAQGIVTYAKKSGNAKVKVDADGDVTVKKGLKAGTYPIVVAITAAGNGNYQAATKTVTAKIRVLRAANKVVPKKYAVSKTFKVAKLKKKAAKVALPKLKTKAGKAKWVVSKADSKKVLTRKGSSVVVRKGAKKGTYALKLKAKVGKTANYNAAVSKVVTVKVKVK